LRFTRIHAENVFARAQNVFARAQNVFARAQNVFARAQNVFARAQNVFARAQNVFTFSACKMFLCFLHAKCFLRVRVHLPCLGFEIRFTLVDAVEFVAFEQRALYRHRFRWSGTNNYWFYYDFPLLSGAFWAPNLGWCTPFFNVFRKNDEVPKQARELHF